MNRLLSALALIAVAGCATPAAETKPVVEAKPAAPARVQRPAFSIPLPSGWEEVTSQQAVTMVGADGVIVENPTVMALPEFRAAQIFVKAIPSKLEVDPANQADCEKIAPNIAKAMQGKVDSAKLVPLPVAAAGTCQIDFSFDQPGATNVHARNTIVSANGAAWMVTCNFDTRDPKASNDCDSVLKGFQPVAASSAGTGTASSAPSP